MGTREKHYSLRGKWKAKAQLGLKLPSDTRSNTKRFCQFAHNKRFRAKSSEKMWDCWQKGGDSPVMDDMDKAEVLDAFPTSLPRSL